MTCSSIGHLRHTFWNQHSLLIETVMFTSCRIRRLSYNLSVCRVTQCASLIALFGIISFSMNRFHIFLIRPLARRHLSDGLRSWRTGPAINQTNLCKGAWALKLWMHLWRSKAGALIVRQMSRLILNWWNNTIVGRLKEFGYKNMWSTWIHRKMSPIMSDKVWKLYKFAWSLKPLFICRSNFNWQIDVDLMQQLREKTGLLEAA